MHYNGGILLFHPSFCRFFMAFTMGIYANPHKNIILENTLPEDKLQDPSVQAIRKRYKNAWFN